MENLIFFPKSGGARYLTLILIVGRNSVRFLTFGYESFDLLSYRDKTN